MKEDALFHTVYGRNLIQGLAETVPQPYVVITMEDLWHLSKDALGGKDLAHVHFVKSLDANELDRLVKTLPKAAGIIGIGGGMALDTAKFVAWHRNLPLFQVPTITSVNAAFTHRIAVRMNGVVRYIGWAVPQVVYVDYDIIQSAPPRPNQAGVGDIFCIHTAHYDWKLATEHGKAGIWPWDDEIAAKTQTVLQKVRKKTSEIHAVSKEGIQTVMEAHRWVGASYHNFGWNPRHIEGCEHFFFYSLEHLTRKNFVHGEPVCLGIIAMSMLQDNDPEGIRRSIDEVGVHVRPQEMGVTWDDVIKALKETKRFAEQYGLFYTTINEREISDDLIDAVKKSLP